MTDELEKISPEEEQFLEEYGRELIEELIADQRSKISAAREKILQLAANYDAANIRVIDTEGDIYFLVALKDNRILSYMRMTGLVRGLKDLTGYQFKVIDEYGLKGEDRQRILQNATPL